MAKIKQVGDIVIHPADGKGIRGIVVAIDAPSPYPRAVNVNWIKFDDIGLARGHFHAERLEDNAFPFDHDWTGWIYPDPPEDPRKYYNAITEKEDA